MMFMIARFPAGLVKRTADRELARIRRGGDERTAVGVFVDRRHARVCEVDVAAGVGAGALDFTEAFRRSRDLTERSARVVVEHVHGAREARSAECVGHEQRLLQRAAVGLNEVLVLNLVREVRFHATRDNERLGKVHFVIGAHRAMRGRRHRIRGGQARPAIARTAGEESNGRRYADDVLGRVGNLH